MNTDILIKLILILLGLFIIAPLIRYLNIISKKKYEKLNREIGVDLRAFYLMSADEKLKHLSNIYEQKPHKNEKDNIENEKSVLIPLLFSLTSEEMEKYVEKLYKKKKLRDLIFKIIVYAFTIALFTIILSIMVVLVFGDDILREYVLYFLGIMFLIFIFEIIRMIYYNIKEIEKNL